MARMGHGGVWGSLLVALVGTGCGSVVDSPSATPPRVLAITPAQDETGVLAGTPVVITFDRPMQRTTTQAAFVSDDVGDMALDFTWSDGDRVLTVITHVDLPTG